MVKRNDFIFFFVRSFLLYLQYKSHGNSKVMKTVAK